jgi:hypothetical protein
LLQRLSSHNIRIAQQSYLLLPKYQLTGVAMKTIAVLTILALLFASAGIAQDGFAGAPDGRVFNSIHIGQKLQVNTKDGKSISGKLEKCTDTGLTLNAKGKSLSFQTADIDTIYLLRGRPIVKRTLIGAGVGGGSGAVAGAIITRNDSWFGPAFGAAILGGVGIIIGSIIGCASGISQKKDLVYEANPAHR